MPEFPIDEAAMLRDAREKEAIHRAMIERFEHETGLKIGPRDPVPVEKPAPTVGGLMSPASNISEAAAASADAAASGTATTTDPEISR